MVRYLTADHLEQLFHIEQRAHLFPWTKKILAEQLFHQEKTFGFFDHETLVGFAIIQTVFPEAELLNIAVDPEHQGKKFAYQLLCNMINTLTQKNYQRLFLEVRISNQAAIRLYEHCGFNQIGLRKNYYPTKKGREDALLYAKELCY